MLAADERVFLWINGLVGRYAVLDGFMKLMVSDFLLPVGLMLATFALWFAGRTQEERGRNQRAFLQAIIGVGFANVFVRVFNDHFFRPRPFVTLEGVNILFYAPTDPSFPSNGVAVVFALAAGVWLKNRRVGTVMLVAAAIFGFARVYAGMHFPLDVVAGALIGVLTSYVFARLLGLLEPVTRLVLWLLRHLVLA